MAYTADEQRIYDFVKGSLPDWFFTLDGADEFMGALVKAVDTARAHRQLWRDQTYILDADGSGPDWLNEHAKDRDTRRQVDEDDDTLKERLRRYADALTRPAILAATQLVMTAGGAAGTAYMVDVRRDCAFFGDYTEQTGTGGTIATVSGNVRTFTPDDPFALPIEVGFARSGSQGNPRLVISGAASGGNDGTFEVTGLVGNAVQYTNATAVAGADAALTWRVRKYDVDGNNREGRARAYFDRGYRFGTGGPMFVVILPFGTPDAVFESVRDMVRQIKAGGVRAIVEVRENP